MMDRKTLLELIPAYAVDALDADEREAVAAFIERDPEAKAIFADYEAISAMLPLAAPMRPAPSHLQDDLRKRLAARKTTTPEERPAPQLLPKAEKSVEKPSRMIPLAAWFVAAAAVIAVVIVGGFLLFRTPSDEMAVARALYNEIVAQPDFVSYQVSAAEGLTVEGELVVSANGRDAVLRIASLPQLSEEQSYQLWTATDGAVDSAGIYHWPTGHGPYFVKIERQIDELVRLGMTIEPFDGSEQPAGDRIFEVLVASAR
jgi:anti-sigma-K factor RskA